jgi:HSP20 family protein
MAIARYNPFAEGEELPTVRFFQDAVNRLLSEPAASRPWAPAVDVFETDNELVLKADLPGVDMKDIDIQLENGTLSLKGQRECKKEGKDGGYHRIERHYGSFVRYFSLPETDYKGGVLTVTLPKKEVAKPRQIKVAVNE